MDDSPRLEARSSPKDDSRTIAELISAALGVAHDDDSYWDAVWALQYRGTSEVLKQVEELCRSGCNAERRLGADVLGQLGVPERTFPKECESVLLGMLDCERDAAVLSAILIALGHLGQPEAIEPASQLREHPDAEVRHGVVLALTGHENQTAIDVLMELSRDEDAHVRDWATFALGQQIGLDTRAIREALAARLDDTDYDTRCEAIVGLAKRGDRRVIPIISKELASDGVGSLVVEAVTMIPDSRFYPQLIALQEWWDVSKGLLSEAIEACSPSSHNSRV
jgi:HEAT repeat protein